MEMTSWRTSWRTVLSRLRPPQHDTAADAGTKADRKAEQRRLDLESAQQVREFHDNDGGYLAWLAAHPDGFVLNTNRTPRPSYLMLHRATCGTISGTPARGAGWTTGDYAKVCGTRTELENFARLRVGGDPTPCGDCLR
jgi:hypothetical protein